MTVAENKELARAVIAAFNRHATAEIDQFFSADYVQHSPGVPPGRGALVHFFSFFSEAFPDGHFEIEDMLGEDDKVLIRWFCSGTQTGSWMGRPPAGKPVKFVGMDLWRFADGKVAEAWFLADTFGLMQQLGRLPGFG